MAEASSGGAGEYPVSSGVAGKQERAGRDDLEPAHAAGQHDPEGKGQVARGHGGESTSRSDHRKNQGRQGGGRGRRYWYSSQKAYRQWDYNGQHLYTEGRHNRSSKGEIGTADENRLVQQSKMDRRHKSDPPAKQKESSERSRERQSGYPGSGEQTKGLKVEGSLGDGEIIEKGSSSERDHRQQRYRRRKERSPQPRRKVKQEASSEELRRAKSESSIDQSDDRSESKGTRLHVTSVEQDKAISRDSLMSEAPGNRDRRMDESVRDNHRHRSNDPRTLKSRRRPRHYDQYKTRPSYGGADKQRYYNQEPTRKHERGQDRSYKDEEKRRPNQNVSSQSGTSMFHETGVKVEEASSIVQPLQQYTECDSAEYCKEQSSTRTSKSDSHVSKSKLDISMEQRHKQETDSPSNSNERGDNLSTPKRQPRDSRGDRGGDGSALLPPTNHNYTTGSVSQTRQQHNSKLRPRPPNPKSRGRKVIPTVQSDELAQQLTAGTYECMVCCDRVRSRDQVWACGNCYHVFHLKCISKWATSPAAALDEESPTEGWRCPGCQNACKVVPSIYKCYCGKVTNPRLRSRGELTVPHGCGDLCLKNLATNPDSTCKHKCRLLCHPGPCPPCPVMVTINCPCGRKTYQVRCSKSMELLSCGGVCGRWLGCGKHPCKENCHSGPCPSCTVPLTQVCYCGKAAPRQVECGQTDEESFSCGAICKRELDCGNHLCELPCHKGACPSCPLLPSHVTMCPCGATPLFELLPEGMHRVSCLDPVPTCSKICGQLLPCSTPDEPHYCPSECHLGDCPPCKRTRTMQCWCGRASTRVECVDVEGRGEYRCQHVCNKKKSCGRHRCSARCCTMTEEAHICDRICGKRLQCSNHFCQERCHIGHCEQCWEYSYEELTCHCGAEVIYPPIPCGTRPPSCYLPCARMHACQHPVTHTCHCEEECPPCTFLMEKECMGEHEIRRNIPCHVMDVSCGNPCARPLPCGMHSCQRTCHRGHCLGSHEVCKQPCTIKRTFCDHPCRGACHVGQPCPDTPCQTLITVTCVCGRRRQTVLCLASGSGAMQQTFQKLFSKDLGTKIRELQSGQSVNISSITASVFGPGGRGKERQLECDEVCAQEERNRKLASALEIENPVISPLDTEMKYSPFLLEQARTDLQFVASVEETMRTLVEAVQKSSSNQTRTHYFRPMKNSQRKLIHELAIHFGCETISCDPEPLRSVLVSVNKSRAKLPPVSLTKLVERERYKPPPAPVNVMAVSGRGEETESSGVERQSLSERSWDKMEKHSAVPDYFADDIDV